MTHLDDTEFVDLVDGTAHATRVAHAESCDVCRARAASVRAMLTAVASAPAEEPSPLYWDNFGAQVNQRIDASATSSGWFGMPRLAFASLALVALFLLGLAVLTPRVNPGATTATPTVATVDVPTDDLDADADWAIVRAAADDLDLEDAHAQGLTARPGTADRLAMELTAAEREELIRIIQEEIKTGA